LEQGQAQVFAMSWSAEQQRLLGAMGYQLMIRVSPGETTAARSPAAALHPALVVAASPELAAARFPQLQMALRRAAGNRDIEGLVEDLERLRREPALKRALWTTLRTLRRSQ
jgi:hypothetical protein